MNLALRQVLTRQTFRLHNGLARKCLLPKPPIVICTIKIRDYCDDRVDVKKLPQLMDFPPIVWPSFLNFIRNWMFANFIIKPYFEQEFSLSQFVEASKHAVQIVSEALQTSDFQSLEGLVDKDTIATLKSTVSSMSLAQRQMLAVQKDDIFYAFPYQVGVMFDESDKRWVEITMCYHVLRGMKRMTEAGDLPPIGLVPHPEYQDKIFVLNYRFIREFTKGVEDSWWLNIVNHFQPHMLMKKF